MVKFVMVKVKAMMFETNIIALTLIHDPDKFELNLSKTVKFRKNYSANCFDVCDS